MISSSIEKSAESNACGKKIQVSSEQAVIIPNFTYRLNNYNTLQKLYHHENPLQSERIKEQQNSNDNLVSKTNYQYQRRDLTKHSLAKNDLEGKNTQNHIKQQITPIIQIPAYNSAKNTPKRLPKKSQTSKELKNQQKTAPRNSSEQQRCEEQGLNCRSAKKTKYLIKKNQQKPKLKTYEPPYQSMEIQQIEEEVRNCYNSFQGSQFNQSCEFSSNQRYKPTKAKRLEIRSRFQSASAQQESQRLNCQLYRQLFSPELNENMQDEDFSGYYQSFSKRQGNSLRPHFPTQYKDRSSASGEINLLDELKEEEAKFDHPQLQQLNIVEQRQSGAFEPAHLDLSLEPRFELNMNLSQPQELQFFDNAEDNYYTEINGYIM